MSRSRPNNVLPCGPACSSTELPRILFLEDSQAAAELICHALVPAWQMLEPQPDVPRPDIVVCCTAQNALDDLKKRAVLGTRGVSDPLELDLDVRGRARSTFLRELRKDLGLRNLPVVEMAWADDLAAIARTLDGLGVVDYDYAVKPMHFSELVTMVGCFCRQILTKTPGQTLYAVNERRPA